MSKPGPVQAGTALGGRGGGAAGGGGGFTVINSQFEPEKLGEGDIELTEYSIKCYVTTTGRRA